MAIKLVDELQSMGNFPIAHAEGINLVKTDGTEDNLQNLFDNGELGGGDSSVTLTQQEYEALSEEQKLDGLYYTYDTKRIFKNGVQYGASEPIPLTMEEYKALGEVDPDQEYIVSADEQGILLEASDIGYSNAVSNLPCTTVQGAIDELNSNLGGLSDNIDGFKNVQIVSALGSTKLKEIIQSEFPKLKNGRGMIRINDGTTLYCGTYIKYSNTQGSATFTNVEGTSYIWTIKGDTATLQELATMDKVDIIPLIYNQNTDILAYALTCPQEKRTLVRIYSANATNNPYGVSTETDFIYEIDKINFNDLFITVRAKDVKNNREFINTKNETKWLGWQEISTMDKLDFTHLGTITEVNVGSHKTLDILVDWKEIYVEARMSDQYTFTTTVPKAATGRSILFGCSLGYAEVNVVNNKIYGYGGMYNNTNTSVTYDVWYR